MRIADGRTSFYQWDHDQMLTVPEDCTEVHFDNGTQPNALCCAVKEDGMVDVPNILLQTAAQIHAYGWNKERKCVVRYVCFWVEPREKPEDYVYTQTDVLRIETEIANQLQALKDSGELTGPKGDPGHTPIKGVDYWTEEDIEEIKSGLNETVLGDIETALDTIIAIQEELINNGGGSDNTCPNCGEALDSDGYCPNGCHEMENTFCVGDEYYTYYAGMTWEDFINSGYNKTVTCPDCGSKNKLAYADGDSVYFLIGACCGIGHVSLYYDEGYEMPVYLAAEIENGHSYYY